ncbi:MAG: polyphosphate kinase 2 family protein [Gammaproteobacteria bacterium]|nr:polyphosphate kinase 2 family protein [Gammaproteobacteria bacterium]MDH3559378.1 polyphosphate kinase 2 family protein [Gammaproteobacteria bacterium]
MFEAPASPYLVPLNGEFKWTDAPTRPPENEPGKKEMKRQLSKLVSRIDELQRIFYAHDRHSLLLVFQGMDAAGKDGTIRAILNGVNPAGCQVFSFKQPTPEELDHDFLWRTSRRLPERGRIGIFNRSYYEEVLVVRVHPHYLSSQKLPADVDLETVWQDRYASIREHEQHLARNGTVVLKFWLNVSREEQQQRFLARLEDKDKNWKFSISDIRERAFWDEYMAAFEAALAETSRPWAPWYAIPADNKSYMRLCVADILVSTLESLDLSYPVVDAKKLAEFEDIRQRLLAE